MKTRQLENSFIGVIKFSLAHFSQSIILELQIHHYKYQNKNWVIKIKIKIKIRIAEIIVDRLNEWTEI